MSFDAFGFPVVSSPRINTIPASSSSSSGGYDDSELREGLAPLSSPSPTTLNSFLSGTPISIASAIPRSFGSSLTLPPGRLSSPTPSTLTLASLSSSYNLPPTPLRSPSSSSVASSPAAMFLSSLTPMSSVASPPPDSAGQSVPGSPDLILGSVLARGGTSIVRLASSSAQPGETSAVKIVTLPSANSAHAKRLRRRIARERTLWASLRHEHILPLFSSTLTPTHAWFVTLPCREGSLLAVLAAHSLPGQRNGLPLDLAGRLGGQTIRGLNYLHTEEGLVHRDIKLENVLVDDSGQARIADFGLAIRLGDVDNSDASDEDDEEEDACSDTEDAPNAKHAPLTTRRRTTTGAAPAATTSGLSAHPSLIRPRPRHLSNVQVSRKTSLPCRGSKPLNSMRKGVPGSLPYAAPELLKTPPASPAFAQDVWALGCVLHALLAGRLPWEDAFEPRLIVAIQCAEYVPPQGIPEAAKEILRACLDRDPSTRLSAAEADAMRFAPDEVVVCEPLASVTEEEPFEIPMPSSAAGTGTDVILEDDEGSDGESEAPLRTPSASRSPMRPRQPSASREWEESQSVGVSGARNRSRSVEVVHAFLRRVRRSMSREKGHDVVRTESRPGSKPGSGTGTPKGSGKRTPSMVRSQTTPLARRPAEGDEYEDEEMEVGKENVDVYVEEVMRNRGRSGRTGRWGMTTSVPPPDAFVGKENEDVVGGVGRARSEMRVL